MTKCNKIGGSRGGMALPRVLVILLVALLILGMLLTIPWSPFPWRLRLTVSHTYRLVPASEMFGRESNEFGKYYTMMNDHIPAATIEKKLRADTWAVAHLRGRFGLKLVWGAAGDGRLDVVQMLASCGAPVNGTVALGHGPKPMQTSPLDAAITFGHFRTARALLNAGADPFEALERGNGNGTTSPYLRGLESKNSAIVAMMKALGPPHKISLGGNAKQLPTTTGEAGGK